MSPEPETKPRVCVLLSTYNGEEFLSEQLDSLRKQQQVEVRIIVRDDGSSDRTPQLLEEYSRGNPNIQVHRGVNLGVVPSFFELMKLAAGCGADYFALCDQDDVWLPDKLHRAVRALDSTGCTPRMYCSTVRYVDCQLRDLGTSRTNLYPSFNNAVVENIATGCTVVFNGALLQLVNSAPPRRALMHDWWLYMVVTAFGRVVFDPESRILYRQHGRNLIGGTSSVARMLLIRLRRMRLRQGGVFRCSDQAREFLDCFGESCPPAHRQVLEELLAARENVVKRLRFALSGKVRRNNWLDDGLLRLLIVAGAY